MEAEDPVFVSSIYTISPYCSASSFLGLATLPNMKQRPCGKGYLMVSLPGFYTEVREAGEAAGYHKVDCTSQS